MKSISGILHQSAVQRFLEALHWVGALHCRAFFWVSHGIHDLIPLRVRTINHTMLMQLTAKMCGS
jgi:hypothetical protein